jgi:hypothetical protein
LKGVFFSLDLPLLRRWLEITPFIVKGVTKNNKNINHVNIDVLHLMICQFIQHEFLKIKINRFM